MKCSRVSLTLLLAAVSAGCNPGPPAVRLPTYNPDATAKRALDLYDRDQNGRLSADELKACPPLLAALGEFDTDSDGHVSSPEIRSRFLRYVQVNAGLQQCLCTVLLDGRPLAGAQVRFVPDPAMGEDFLVGVAKADENGVADIRCAEQPMPGLFCGLYRVEVRRVIEGKETVPARYNTRTELGCELPPGGMKRGEKNLIFRLTS